MEGISTKSGGYPWVSNTSPMNGPQVSNTTERHSAFDFTPHQSSDSDSDSSSSYAGTSFADTSIPTSIPSTTQENESRMSQEVSNGVNPPTSPKHSARWVLNERLEIEIHRTDRDVEQLQMLEQMFVDTAYDNAARQRLVQIRERLVRARQKSQLLTSLRESADRLEKLDFKFLLRNLL